MKKLVRESIDEGVGDKYLQQKHGIPDEFEKFDRQYAAMQRGKKQTSETDVPFIKKGDWVLVKNPTSLKDFGSSVRGVIVKGGDVYLESYSDVIHHDILLMLEAKGVISGPVKKNWNRMWPDEVGYLTVQRYKDSVKLGIGESNKLIYTTEDFAAHKDRFLPFIEEAKKKNPTLNLVPKLVGTKMESTRSGHVMYENFTEMIPRLQRGMSSGLTSAKYSNGVLKITHSGSMGNSIERSVDPNLKRMGLPTVTELTSKCHVIEEKGSPDYYWVLKVKCNGSI